MLKELLLLPYSLTLKVRHALYDKGIRKVHHCEVPTICVGNIAAGGTGKTPHTEMIIRSLLNTEEWKDKNLAVLSRGHKRKSSGFQQVILGGNYKLYGDEPLQIKNKFPKVTVAVDRSRIEGCNYLCHPELVPEGIDNNFPASDLIVLDDAFQYRDLQANFNIVLVDYNRPIHKDNLLPFGRLRDLPSRLNYADVIIISKCPNYLDDWERKTLIDSLEIKKFDKNTCTGINKLGRKTMVLFTTINYCELESVYPEGNTRYMYSEKLILFTGIAKDTALSRFLSDKYKIIKRFKFSDHHKYNYYDIYRIKRVSKKNPTAVIVTTEKDSQRIHDYKKMPLELKERLFQVPIEVAFLSDIEKKAFETNLLQTLKAHRSEHQ